MDSKISIDSMCVTMKRDSNIVIQLNDDLVCCVSRDENGTPTIIISGVNSDVGYKIIKEYFENSDEYVYKLKEFNLL